MTNYNNQESTYLELDPNTLLKPKWGNPRRQISAQDYADRKASIKANGIHTPLQVRYVEDGF